LPRTPEMTEIPEGACPGIGGSVDERHRFHSVEPRMRNRRRPPTHDFSPGPSGFSSVKRFRPRLRSAYTAVPRTTRRTATRITPGTAQASNGEVLVSVMYFVAVSPAATVTVSIFGSKPPISTRTVYVPGATSGKE